MTSGEGKRLAGKDRHAHDASPSLFQPAQKGGEIGKKALPPQPAAAAWNEAHPRRTQATPGRHRRWLHSGDVQPFAAQRLLCRQHKDGETKAAQKRRAKPVNRARKSRLSLYADDKIREVFTADRPVLSFWRSKANIRSEKRPLAIEIAGGKLWLAQMSAADARDEAGRRILLRCQQAPLPDSAKALGQWLDSASFGGLPAMLLLAEHEYMVQVAELPQVAAEEVRDAMRWRLAEIFGLTDDQEVSFDYQPLPGQGFNPTPNQALVFAIDNPLLQARQNLLLGSGLDLQVVDTQDMAQRNLATLLESDERGQATLSLGERGGLLTVTQHDTLFLSRRLDVSLSAWQQATAERRAEFCERIALEIQRSLDVFDRQYSAVGLSRLLIAPMPEREEFIGQLADNLYIPVAPYVLEQAINLDGIAELRDPLLQAQAWGVIGLSLRPPEDRQ